jgi:hypothetical protein
MRSTCLALPKARPKLPLGEGVLAVNLALKLLKNFACFFDFWQLSTILNKYLGLRGRAFYA